MERPMRGSIRIVIAACLATGLFLAGGLGVFRALPTQRGSHPRALDHDALLGPTARIGSIDVAIAALQRRLTAAPDDWRAAASLGIAYVQRARITADPSSYPLAEDALARSLRIQPRGNGDALIGRSSLASARHDFAGALRWGLRAVAVNPYDADAYGALGDAQLELGRYRTAFRTFQRMVDTRPDTASYARASYARELTGDVDGAIAAMRLAYRVAAGRSDQAWAATQLGQLRFGAGDPAGAARWFRRAAALAPGFLPADAGLGLVAWSRGDLEAAISRFESVVGRYPGPEYVGILADLQAAAGDRSAAAQTRRLVGAEIRLFRANGVDTDLELALFEADHGSARAALRAARAEWGRRHSVHVADALAWALYANRRYHEAAAASRAALRLGTRNALFLFHAGMIQLRLGHPDRAREFLAGAIARNPSFSVRWSPVAARTLERLERLGRRSG
jgi:tetratricopeptide (TPR) repeat protein